MSTDNNLTDMITVISSSRTEGEDFEENETQTIKSQSCLKSPNRLQELAGEPEDQFVGDNQIR